MVLKSTDITHPRRGNNRGLSLTAIAITLLMCLLAAGQALSAAPKEYAGGDVQALAKNLKANPALAKKAFTGGMTLLHFAAQDGNVAAAKLLISKGAKINARTAGNQDTPLTIACGFDMIKLLVDSGADVKHSDVRGATALHKAGSVEIAKYLIDHGANVNKATVNGRTPLIIASVGYDKDLVEFLLSRGANVNARCELGSALTVATNRGKSAEIVKILLRKGTDVNITDQAGVTPLEFARKRKDSLSPTDQAIVKLLEDAALGVNVATIEVKDVFEPSQLFEAARLGDVFAVSAILKADRDLANACDDLGATALHLAADGVSDSPTTSAAVVKLLLAADADVNFAKNDGVTPLHVAAALGKIEAAKALLAGGAKPGLADAKGRTPLSIAKDRKNKAMVDLLSKPVSGSTK